MTEPRVYETEGSSRASRAAHRGVSPLNDHRGQYKLSVIRGVDGCKGGWLCLSVRPGECRPSAVVFASDARELLAGSALVTTIDIPIGLPSIGVASPFMWKKKNGAFFRLVKCTTSRPPWQAATGGTRREKAYQQVGRSA
jgi:Protein of unknown function (DUF429)